MNSFIKSSPMRTCVGKNCGGHEMIVHASMCCPLCEARDKRRQSKNQLEAILYVRRLLLVGEITLDEYITRTKEEMD